jgi:hypothetical protein
MCLFKNNEIEKIMKAKKNLVFILIGLLLSITFISCKSELEKIDLNDIEAHRAYQERIFWSDTTSPQKMLLNLKTLIKEYKELEKNNPDNDNLNYYLARLYSKVNDIPREGLWVDTVSNTFKNELDYVNFIDSTYYYAEKCLQKNEDNILAMYVLSYTNFQERDFSNWYYYYHKKKIKTPISYERDSSAFLKRINCILNNPLRFKDIDTTKEKYRSRGITEVALNILDLYNWKEIDKFNIKNKEIVYSFYNLGEFYDFTKDHEKVVYNYDVKLFEKRFLKTIILARKEVKRLEYLAAEQQKKEQQLEALKNININHKYSYCNSEALVTGMIEISFSDHYFQMVQSYNGPTLKGRGNVQRLGSSLLLTNTSGIGINGKLDMYLLPDNRIVLVTSKGAVYVQDDELTYIKNMISTNPLRSQLIGYESDNSISTESDYNNTPTVTSLERECDDMTSFEMGNSAAQQQVGNGILTDCDQMWDNIHNVNDGLSHYCFCKGWEKYVRSH